ncbi:MAG: transposase [Chloroflexi bacterium]|nr:transposase [Chloroflexota bacterium]
MDGLCRDTAAALAEPMADLEAAVRQSRTVHPDETRWRQAGDGRWLWVAADALATVCRIAASRGSAVIQGLRGEDFGTAPAHRDHTATAWSGGRACLGGRPRRLGAAHVGKGTW